MPPSRLVMTSWIVFVVLIVVVVVGAFVNKKSECDDLHGIMVRSMDISGYSCIEQGKH